MNLSKWARHLYQPVLPLGSDGRRVTGGKEHIALSRRAAAEGMVLLKNENGVLPVQRGAKVALFGKAGADYVKGGGGSGDVTVAYVRSLIDGMRVKEQEGKVLLYEPLNEFYEANVRQQYAEGIVPGLTLEPELSEELLKGAAAFADVAIVSICRFSGENWDRTTKLDAERKTSTELTGAEKALLDRAGEVFERGDFYLSNAEERLIARVKALFEKVVIVLNTGGMISAAWFARDERISSVLLAWQAGMEGGLAEADVLLGDVNPSGRLADTFVGRLEDCPYSGEFHESLDYVNYTEDVYVGYRYFETIPGKDRLVIYPFGFGLSYTKFRIAPLWCRVCGAELLKTIEGGDAVEAGQTQTAGDGGFAEAESTRNAGGEDAPGTVPENNANAKAPGNAASLQSLFEGENAPFVEVVAEVTNIGSCAGREVVQLYCSAPQGKLGKPARELKAFCKTRLLMPGETAELCLRVPVRELASFDDLGKVCGDLSSPGNDASGERLHCPQALSDDPDNVCGSAWVLEKGRYEFYLGTSVRDTVCLDLNLELKEDIVVEEAHRYCAPACLPERLRADGSLEPLPMEGGRPQPSVWEGLEKAGIFTPAVRARKGEDLMRGPKEGLIRFAEVADGSADFEEFFKQLSMEDKVSLLGGQPNTGVANTFGMGNLPEYGVPSVMTADGPAGLRIRPEVGVTTTAFPCATLLACTWDCALIEEIGRAGGMEVAENNIGIWLAPAMNIHRSPLCGRNFEYYSEDPLLAGKMAAAIIRGVQSCGVSACAKHFACNNKETNRFESDSRLSARALREIYLKGFEIAVKEADPRVIMTSYNLINGVRASENRELIAGILRGEWGFRGMVTTDWWNHASQPAEIRAGNDVKMGCGYPEKVLAALRSGDLTAEEIDSCARRVLQMILSLD